MSRLTKPAVVVLHATFPLVTVSMQKTKDSVCFPPEMLMIKEFCNLTLTRAYFDP